MCFPGDNRGFGRCCVNIRDGIQNLLYRSYRVCHLSVLDGLFVMAALESTRCVEGLSVPHTKQRKPYDAVGMMAIAVLFTLKERVTEDTLRLQMLLRETQ